MFYLLNHIGQTIRTVNVNELGLLVDECLVTLGTQNIPNLCQLVGQTDNGTGLDIKVSGIIPCSDCQTGYMLVRFVLGVGAVSHAITVMLLIVGRSLNCIVHV